MRERGKAGETITTQSTQRLITVIEARNIRCGGGIFEQRRYIQNRRSKEIIISFSTVVELFPFLLPLRHAVLIREPIFPNDGIEWKNEKKRKKGKKILPMLKANTRTFCSSILLKSVTATNVVVIENLR